MTGGQDVEGQMSVAELAHSLRAEGVKRIVITTEDPSRYDGVALPAGAEVRDRDRLLAAQRELAQVPGVTVLIHDQACATELRRARKRGQGRRPAAAGADQRARLRGLRRLRREVGLPVGRAGRDRVRPQDADPPDLVQQGLLLPRRRLPVVPHVIPPQRPRSRRRVVPRCRCPSPSRASADDVRVRLVGIGGTGVVTVSQVLGMAALLDGRHAAGSTRPG